MRAVLNLLKFCWKALNFIRDCVMNLVFLLFVLFAFTVFGLIANFNPENKETLSWNGNPGALLLNLDGYLADNRAVETWRSMLRQVENKHAPVQISTFDVVYAIGQAKSDPRIKGIVLDLNYFEGADMPAIEYVGQALEDFKQADKTVTAVSDNYGQAQYLLASYADKIYMNSAGEVDIHGLAYQNLYYKSMLEKLAITPHVFRVGTYKSAVEPFLRDDMSPEAKQNARQWLEPMWTGYVRTVAANRNIDKNAVLPAPEKYLADLKALKGDLTAYAKQRNLITDLSTRAETNNALIEMFGRNKEGKFRSVDFFSYLDQLPDRMTSESAQKIAVVNVEGTIIDGENDEQDVGGDSVSRLLRKARDDDKIKAVVLRVNSPGGSAFAAEIIRQETDYLQAAGKPVVVSMGNMAASGGYWISSTADWIVADPNTITGSIGIFAMFPTFENTLKKAGVTADGIATSSLSQISAARTLPQDVKDILQLNVEHGYEQFLATVGKGRKLTREQADKVGQGQVWLGTAAFNHKLVDELGNFDTALNKAAELARLDDFGVEWLEDDDGGLFGRIFKDFGKSAKNAMQSAVTELFGLPPQQTKRIMRPFGILSKFNDPKGQYSYCLNCGEIH